jgi:hypothetical protein
MQVGQQQMELEEQQKKWNEYFKTEFPKKLTESVSAGKEINVFLDIESTFNITTGNFTEYEGTNLNILMDCNQHIKDLVFKIKALKALKAQCKSNSQVKIRIASVAELSFYTFYQMFALEKSENEAEYNNMMQDFLTKFKDVSKEVLGKERVPTNVFFSEEGKIDEEQNARIFSKLTKEADIADITEFAARFKTDFTDLCEIRAVNKRDLAYKAKYMQQKLNKKTENQQLIFCDNDHRYYKDDPIKFPTSKDILLFSVGNAIAKNVEGDNILLIPIYHADILKDTSDSVNSKLIVSNLMALAAQDYVVDIESKDVITCKYPHEDEAKKFKLVLEVKGQQGNFLTERHHDITTATMQSVALLKPEEKIEALNKAKALLKKIQDNQDITIKYFKKDVVRGNYFFQTPRKTVSLNLMTYIDEDIKNAIKYFDKEIKAIQVANLVDAIVSKEFTAVSLDIEQLFGVSKFDALKDNQKKYLTALLLELRKRKILVSIVSGESTNQELQTLLEGLDKEGEEVKEVKEVKEGAAELQKYTLDDLLIVENKETPVNHTEAANRGKIMILGKEVIAAGSLKEKRVECKRQYPYIAEEEKLAQNEAVLLLGDIGALNFQLEDNICGLNISQEMQIKEGGGPVSDSKLISAIKGINLDQNEAKTLKAIIAAKQLQLAKIVNLQRNVRGFLARKEKKQMITNAKQENTNTLTEAVKQAVALKFGDRFSTGERECVPYYTAQDLRKYEVQVASGEVTYITKIKQVQEEGDNVENAVDVVLYSNSPEQKQNATLHNLSTALQYFTEEKLYLVERAKFQSQYANVLIGEITKQVNAIDEEKKAGQENKEPIQVATWADDTHTYELSIAPAAPAAQAAQPQLVLKITKKGGAGEGAEAPEEVTGADNIIDRIGTQMFYGKVLLPLKEKKILTATEIVDLTANINKLCTELCPSEGSEEFKQVKIKWNYQYNLVINGIGARLQPIGDGGECLHFGDDIFYSTEKDATTEDHRSQTTKEYKFALDSITKFKEQKAVIEEALVQLQPLEQLQNTRYSIPLANGFAVVFSNGKELKIIQDGVFDPDPNINAGQIDIVKTVTDAIKEIKADEEISEALNPVTIKVKVGEEEQGKEEEKPIARLNYSNIANSKLFKDAETDDKKQDLGIKDLNISQLGDLGQGKEGSKARVVIKQDEAKETNHQIAKAVLQKTINSLNDVTMEDMNLFVALMQQQIAKYQGCGTEDGANGKEAGFSAWKGEIRQALETANLDSDSLMKKFANISAKIQLNTKGLGDTIEGRGYYTGDSKLGIINTAYTNTIRSFRLLQLLDPDKIKDLDLKDKAPAKGK